MICQPIRTRGPAPGPRTTVQRSTSLRSVSVRRIDISSSAPSSSPHEQRTRAIRCERCFNREALVDLRAPETPGHLPRTTRALARAPPTRRTTQPVVALEHVAASRWGGSIATRDFDGELPRRGMAVLTECWHRLRAPLSSRVCGWSRPGTRNMSSPTAQPAARSSTTPPQVKPGPSLMTLVEASSRGGGHERSNRPHAQRRSLRPDAAPNLSAWQAPSSSSRPRAQSLSVQLRQHRAVRTAMTSPFRPNSPRNSRAPPRPSAHQQWRVLVVVDTLVAAATVLELVVTPTTLTEPVRWAETQNLAGRARLPAAAGHRDRPHRHLLRAHHEVQAENHDRRGRISARTKGWLKLSKLAVAQAVLSVLSVVCFYVGEELYLLPDSRTWTGASAARPLIALAITPICFWLVMNTKNLLLEKLDAATLADRIHAFNADARVCGFIQSVCFAYAVERGELAVDRRATRQRCAHEQHHRVGL